MGYTKGIAAGSNVIKCMKKHDELLSKEKFPANLTMVGLKS